MNVKKGSVSAAPSQSQRLTPSKITYHGDEVALASDVGRALETHNRLNGGLCEVVHEVEVEAHEEQGREAVDGRGTALAGAVTPTAMASPSAKIAQDSEQSKDPFKNNAESNKDVRLRVRRTPGRTGIWKPASSNVTWTPTVGA